MKKRVNRFISGILSAAITLSAMASLTLPAYAAEEDEPAALKVGDYIRMGEYGGDPIVWIVAGFYGDETVENDDLTLSESLVSEYDEEYSPYPLLIARDIVTIKAFDAGYDALDENILIDAGSSHSREADPNEPTRADGSNYWGDSNLRTWLNSDSEAGKIFWPCGVAPEDPEEEDPIYASLTIPGNAYADKAGFLTGFNEDEQAAILEVTQSTVVDIPYDGEPGEGYDIENPIWLPENFDEDSYAVYYKSLSPAKKYDEAFADKIFIPDIRQMSKAAIYLSDAFVSPGFTVAVPSDAADNEIPEGSDYGYYKELAYEDYTVWYPYWLRNPSNGSGSRVAVANFIDEMDAIVDLTANWSDIGVRPACCIDASKIDFENGDGTDEIPYTIKETPKYTITYDYTTNGGTSIGISTNTAVYSEGTNADVSVEAYKDTGDGLIWAFVGWNSDPDAHEGLESYEVTEDATLYLSILTLTQTVL